MTKPKKNPKLPPDAKPCPKCGAPLVWQFGNPASVQCSQACGYMVGTSSKPKKKKPR